MNMIRTSLLALAIATAFTGCNAGRDAADDTGTAIEKNVEVNVGSAMEKARHKLATENITVDAQGQPDAEITPNGDLLIDGKAVPVTAGQRALLLQYRADVSAVAAAGMDVGVQGARLAASAMGEALRGVFTGEADQVEERVEARAAPIREAALRICDHLPAMYRTQQQLSASLPAFAPYAKMDASDIEDCRRDVMDDAAPTPPAPPAAPSPPPARAGTGSDAVSGSDETGAPRQRGRSNPLVATG